MNNRGEESWQCNCGAADCRKTIHSDFFQLPLEKQVEYLPLQMDWFVEENAAEIATVDAGTIALGGPGAGGDATAVAILGDLLAIGSAKR